MSTGTIIAIAIVVAAIIVLAVAGFMAFKKAKPTLKNANDLQELINQKKKFYLRESEHLTEKVNTLTQRAEGIQSEAEVKMTHFKEFMDKQGEFQSSLRYLQAHAGGYAKGISSNLKDELKEDGPKITETFKRAFKKTIEKQKERHQN